MCLIQPYGGGLIQSLSKMAAIPQLTLTGFGHTLIFPQLFLFHSPLDSLAQYVNPNPSLLVIVWGLVFLLLEEEDNWKHTEMHTSVP